MPTNRLESVQKMSKFANYMTVSQLMSLLRMNHLAYAVKVKQENVSTETISLMVAEL